MSQVAPQQKSLPAAVRVLYAPIQQHLTAVEEVLGGELHNNSPFVDELLQYGGQLGGKRLRPALLLLAGQAVGRIDAAHYTLAAVIEMIHTATLVHDDVLDEADTRRHLATVNTRWNNETSVLLGDYLFSHAFYLASTLKDTYACQRIGRSTNIVCEGELKQVGHRGNHALTEEDYLEIINGKTAELCACACHLGAHYASASQVVVAAMENYGRHLGMAFQIADDLLDLVGDEKDTGKSLGTDLEKKKPTLPLIRCYQLASPREREQLVGILETATADRRRELASWFERFDALSYTRHKARAYVARALDELEAIPASPARETLQELSEFVVSRSL